MGDDLDDNWWEGQDEFNNDEDSTASTKRTHSETVEGDDEREIVKEEADPPKKKRKRKTMSDIIKEKGTKPLSSADVINQLNKHYKDKLTKLEWDEIKLDESQFTVCNDGSHTANSYFKAAIPKWKRYKESMTKSADHGSPLLLIVCSAASRAVKLIKDIADFKGDDCKVAKLFAKHLKVTEQTRFLSKNVIHIGYGTPNRIGALIENGSLKLDKLQCIVLDWSWRDIKHKTIIDIPPIRNELFTLLKQQLIPCVKRQKHTRIGLF